MLLGLPFPGPFLASKLTHTHAHRGIGDAPCSGALCAQLSSPRPVMRTWWEHAEAQCPPGLRCSQRSALVKSVLFVLPAGSWLQPAYVFQLTRHVAKNR